ncbi:transglycosylase SLT domain-containing protein [Lysobacter koreensis]|uniref:Transglycosylase SLT domain-containing protein n=1 Tax=Lysobacter koreensis TaxID=266122 RepID=A0ABW2YLZ7_9GAMM
MIGVRSSRAPAYAWLCGSLLLALSTLAPSRAGERDDGAATPPSAATSAPAGTRNGREIYQRFREGLADPNCDADASARWRQHFAAAPKRLATRNDDMLPLFGYVVDALRAASLPTEYALIPLVESGYQPGARSAAGPAGLWQMIALTARNHRVPISKGYDGRLSPVDSTRAAVRYLKTLHSMFAGDWRLAAMAYNAGEYRILGALKRSGQTARNATPEQLPGLSGITHAYVRKLHALSCVLKQAEDRDDWLRALDRPVPRLAAVTVPADVADIAGWAARTGHDGAQLRRLNPAFGNGRIGKIGAKRAPLLAVATAGVGASSEPGLAAPVLASGSLAASASNDAASVPATYREHTVIRGDSPWTIARRYGIGVGDLLQRNGLGTRTVLKPGRVLAIDPRPAGE